MRGMVRCDRVSGGGEDSSCNQDTIETDVGSIIVLVSVNLIGVGRTVSANKGFKM